MTDNRKQNPESRKGIPGSFIFFLFLLFLVFMGLQTFTSDKYASVSFSHEVEHLVNLQLIYPDQSKKIALNDNLVTFSGKFLDALSEESKERYHYLELVGSQKELSLAKNALFTELNTLQENVQNASAWFLEISGISFPRGGFVVVGPVYDTSYRSNSIIITKPPVPQTVNLATLQEELQKAPTTLTEEYATGLKEKTLTLLQMYRSSKLGIGSATYKNMLKEQQEALEALDISKNNPDSIFAACKGAIQKISEMSVNLAKPIDNVRLSSLRSVRNYLEKAHQYNDISQALEKNTALLEKARQNVTDVVWFFNNKEVSSRTLEEQDAEAFSHWFSQAKTQWNNFSKNKGLLFRSPDQPRNLVLEKNFKSEEPAPNYFSYLFTLLPIALVVLAIYFLFSRQMKGVGSSAMNFGKSPARLLSKEKNQITFKDVAGADEAKEELKEIVDFLKDPLKFTVLGARIPKGVLLVGPPGTGKTLIAKAVAGEAERPFFSISGSDFVEMFVGVGASRIRDLFLQARKSAPCIIFIDEIDAVGRHRGAGIGGGHDEREQTLNQLLVEMDGFDTKEGVILMAATNRPDILDKALLRPGRFDRRVVLDLPDIKGRYEILKVHARRIKIDPSVNLMDIARNTPGASGADLENMLNEAALMAAGKGRSAVTSVEAKEACDKVRYGKERRSLEVTLKEKETTAYHESGHAIVGLVVESADPVDKVTIIPRGFSLGATHFMPKKNRLNYWKKEVVDQLAICMGGRAAEELFVHDISSGAQQDILQATKLARAMVCEWGMSDLGAISFDERQGRGDYLDANSYHDKNYSEETAEKIDKEVGKLLEQAHQRAVDIVTQNKDKVDLMTKMLIEFESLDTQDLKEIMTGTWDINKKRERMKIADELQIKPTVAAPTTPVTKEAATEPQT